MTDTQAREIIRTRYAEFGCTTPPTDLTGTVHHSPSGFAIVRPMGHRTAWMTPAGHVSVSGPEPRLEWLWVYPAQRGRGAGRALVREVLRLYGGFVDVVAVCHGDDRARFFRSCGFGVQNTAPDGWHGLRWKCQHPLAGVLRGG